MVLFFKNSKLPYLVDIPIKYYECRDLIFYQGDWEIKQVEADCLQAIPSPPFDFSQLHYVSEQKELKNDKGEIEKPFVVSVFDSNRNFYSIIPLPDKNYQVCQNDEATLLGWFDQQGQKLPLVTSIKYFELKDISMFMLLHLNEDFDDDLLLDCIKLLIQE